MAYILPESIISLHLFGFLVHDVSSLQYCAALPLPGAQTHGIPRIGPELPEV